MSTAWARVLFMAMAIAICAVAAAVTMRGSRDGPRGYPARAAATATEP